MVLIIYIRTLASNEKFIYSSVRPQTVVVLLLLSLMLPIFFKEKAITLKLTTMPRVVSSMYECSNMSILIFLIVYLFLAMVCVVKLVKFESGPLIKRL